MALPMILCACTSPLEYIFQISNGHDFIRANNFRIMTVINFIEFCIINVYRRKFKLEDTETTRRQMHYIRVTMRNIKELPLHSLVTILAFEASITLQKHRYPERTITVKQTKVEYRNKIVRIALDVILDRMDVALI